jgi:hypothetical protein
MATSDASATRRYLVTLVSDIDLTDPPTYEADFVDGRYRIADLGRTFGADEARAIQQL